MLIPWTTDTGEILRTDTGEMLQFLVDYDFGFLTSPVLVSEADILYLYDIEVSDFNEKEITMIGENLPSPLTFVQLTNSKARLYGYFETAGAYTVLISADDGDYKIYQEFTITVSDPIIESTEDPEDLGTKFFIAYEDEDVWFW